MQQTSLKGIQKKTWLGSEHDPLGIVQDTEILPYK